MSNQNSIIPKKSFHFCTVLDFNFQQEYNESKILKKYWESVNMDFLKLRFQHNPTKPNHTRQAYAEFIGCDVQSIKGISGITQYEDEAEYRLKDKNKLQLPDFSVMHYLQYEAALYADAQSKIVLHCEDDTLTVPVSQIGKELRTFTVNDKFSIDIYLHEQAPTGSLHVTPDSVRSGDRETFEITYTPGPVPIQKGGVIRILTPFTSFSAPCEKIEERFYYTSPKAKLSVKQAPYAFQFRGYVYDITVESGEFCQGDSFTLLHTNLSDRGITVQPYIQDEVYFLGWEDSTGRGIFNPLPLSQCAKFEVVPNLPRRIRVKAQQLMRPGESLACELLVLDDWYNPTFTFSGTLEISLSGEGTCVKQTVPVNCSRAECVFENLQSGFYVLEARGEGLKPEKLSVYVDDGNTTRLYYGQLHAHSEVSDGTFTPEHYFHYGKEYGMLDFCSLTDHDWEVVEHARNKDNQKLGRLREICNRYNEDGRYATIIGYEWMGNEGHINVYFSGDENLDVYSGNVSLLKQNRMYCTQKEFVDAYRGREDVILIPHISHGSSLDTFDETLEPAVEIYSMWGYSEDTSACRKDMPGFKQFLSEGKKFALIGGADAHHGMPGQTGLHSKYTMLRFREGLACVLSDQLTRKDIFRNLKERNCYAVTGERILLLPKVVCSEDALDVELIIGGTNPVISAEVIGNAGTLLMLQPNRITAIEKIRIPRTHVENEFYYIKVTQNDGEKAYFNLCNFLN